MKKYLFNFAIEGRSLILTTMGISLLSLVLYYRFDYDVFLTSFYMQGFFFLVCCFFFRDPIREVIDFNKNQFLSPADGTILSVKDIEDPDIGPAKKISIFLSFFNVHRQWVPSTSQVLNMYYNPGKYFIAFKDKASLDNEHTSILFKDDNNNPFRIKQIAGFIARRIVNHMQPDLKVEKGQKLGFIKFGSRVEIIVPDYFQVSVKKGDKVKGCKTILGEFKS
tara:strand:+ start:2191 stop:2856 length:666 start_codon:yes stop_codon:yes gene_type:complete